MFLEKINGVADLKKLKRADLPLLCEEIRQVLLTKLSRHGGHIGPNLGMVELTCALHYVFDSPTDKILFDVSHQCYTHKILTGRKNAFLYPEHYDDVNGFTNPNESEHDIFTVGHTSTALSLACGLAKARDLKGETHNVVAVIGDGSLSGGEAYEGLNNISEQGTNFIAVVNDNEMSIAENHGGYCKNLEILRQTNGKAKDNLFKALGFQYIYIEEGNNVEQLVKVFKKLKNTPKPIVVHVHTQKGKGFWAAEQNREMFHSGGPFSVENGTFLYGGNNAESYNEITYNYLAEKAKNDSTVVAISSATPTVLGMSPSRRSAMGKQFVDVGICEEHAVAFASGIAKGGAKPVYGVFGSFLQRSFDQIHQDLALDNNPATLLLFWDSVYGMGGPTHNGLYDIAELSNIPNLVYLAPTCKEEYLEMLNWSLEQTEKSVAIRVPMAVVSRNVPKQNYSLLKSQVAKRGSGVAVFAVGSLFPMGEHIVSNLAAQGVNATLVNPVFLSGLDTDLLQDLKADHQLVVTLEEGILEGGYGQKIASYLGDSDVKVKNFGLQKSFFGDFHPETLLQQNGLTEQNITEYILKTLQKH